MEIEQLAFYMSGNKIHSAKITSKTIVENVHEDWAHTKKQTSIWTPFGKAGTFYATCHGIIHEDDCFASKEELAASL